MSDQTKLERRYRRLLAIFPKCFRSESREEVLSVLMAGAEPGQEWPRMSEAADLVRSGVWMRLRLLRYPTSVELRHPAPWVLIRVLVGLWLTVLAIILTTQSWWGLALVPAALLNFYLAYRVAVATESERRGGLPPAPPPVGLGR
jgi:hypothetical protein